MSLAVPTPFFAVPWRPVEHATVYLDRPGKDAEPFFAVPWGHKAGAVYYPYDPEDAFEAASDRV